MKLLIITTYYLPHRTGMTLHIERMARGMAQKGHEVIVLAAWHDRAKPKEEWVDGVRIIRFKPLFRISRGVIAPSFFFKVFSWLKWADAVSLHSPSLEMIWTAPICRIMRKPFVITHHGDLTLPKDKIVSLFVEPAVYWLSFLAARFARKITGYSHDYIEQSRFLRRVQNKTVKIYPPAVIPVPSSDAKVRLKKKWGAEGQIILGYAGRFVEEKRPDRLIRAIPLIKERIGPVKLVFAGSHKLFYENYFERCKELIEKHEKDILFLGMLLNEQDVADFYSACDVLVLPSETECLGLVQVEAMLCGTPVIVNNIPGGREAVRVTGMGEVVQCDNPLMLAQAVERIVHNPSAYIKTREAVEQCYSYKKTIEEYESLFKEIIARS
ncbi:MAG: glycosyltransferase family 4 protein [Candidatus Omnitrophica bacterium]|nr:glycosyltransferase family 4 protein [Candidatus Omnitrophota bacterium]